MLNQSNTDPSPEPPKPKRIRYKVILKLVLKAFATIWSVYRFIMRAIEFLKELLG